MKALIIAMMVVFLVFPAAVEAGVAAPGWMYHGGPDHTGVYDDGGVHTTISGLWNYTIGKGMISSLAISNGTIYGASIDGKLCAIDGTTGRELWNRTIGDADLESTPAVYDGIVYIGNWNGTVYALDAATGEQIWGYDTGDSVISSPAVSNGIVYAGSYDRNVYALDAATGRRIWSYRTGGCVGSSPAVSNGIVYAGCADGAVYAIDASSGTLKWKFITGASVWASPAVADGLVYIGSFDSNVYALNATTGKKVWFYRTNGTIDTCPAVTNEAVFIGCDDGSVYALNAATGAPLWNFRPGSNNGFGGGPDLMRVSPVVVNGIVYIMYDRCSMHAETHTYPEDSMFHGESYTEYIIENKNSTISALDAFTGLQVWNRSIDILASGYWMPSMSSPVMANGILYVGTCDGSVHAIGSLPEPAETQAPVTGTATEQKPSQTPFAGIEGLITIALAAIVYARLLRKK